MISRPAKGASENSLPRFFSRLALHVGRNGILQIENNPIAIEIADFFERPDVDGRNRQQRTARSHRNIFEKISHAALVSSFCDICNTTIH